MYIVLCYNFVYKEFIIDLTTNEKRTFFRFLGLYLASSFILFIIIGFLYYQNEKRLYLDLAKTKVENEVSKIASKIIFAHMSNKELNIKDFLSKNKYELSFYNDKKEKILGNINKQLDFSKKILLEQEYFILISDATFGHLGVSYIAIKDYSFSIYVKELQENIVLIFLSLYSIISLIGFYLARLFLQPIKDEREKLNNFIKDTTHELNTPISAILMSAEGKEETLSKKQSQRIQIAAHRISEIYKDLTYVFLEEKEDKKDLKEISLDEIVLEQLKYFEVLAEKKKLTINKDIKKLNFKVERNDFIRLFNNILSNAIKYNKKNGSIHIIVNEKQLIIKDTGIGIDENKIKDIFKRYFRATSTSGGFGLGLNIVRDICQRYNIKTNVSSIQNKETIFTFTF